ncbi:MAG: alpha/beta fold hydrolase [Deltaproteobacteria bacterium]|nr:alpha/beta fold hydrolase [Deltaproteobacteria bacterium]
MPPIHWTEYLTASTRLAAADTELDLRELAAGYAQRAGIPTDTLLAMEPRYRDSLARLQEITGTGNPRITPRELQTWFADLRIWMEQEREWAAMQRDPFYAEVSSSQLHHPELSHPIYYRVRRPRVGMMYDFSNGPDPARTLTHGVLVSVHGLFQDHRSLDPLTNSLMKEGLLHHWSHDQPGFGASQTEGITDGRPFQDALVALLRKVRETYRDPITLLGFSMGGTVALRVAQDHPELVDSLVLISPFLERRRAGMADTGARYLLRYARAIARGEWGRVPVDFSGREVLLTLQGVEHIVALEEAAAGMAAELRNEPFRFSGKTLVIHNPNDGLILPEPVERIFSGQPHVEVRSYNRTSDGKPDTSHNIFFDEEVRDEVLRFLQRPKSGSPFYAPLMAWDARLEAKGLRRLEGRVIPLPVTPKFLNAPQFSPRRLIDLLMQDPELKDLWPVVVVPQERFTLEEHTLLVLKQFERYFSRAEFPPPMDRGFFRLLLALHDIGKPKAVLEGDSHRHHAYTAEIIARTLPRMGYGDHVQIALAMVESDFGLFVMGCRTLVKYPHYFEMGYSERIDFYERRIRTELGLTPDEAENVIAEVRATKTSPLLLQILLRNTLASLIKSAEAAQMPLSEFFRVRLMYYFCDAGSYTTNATDGHPQLGTLSAFDDLFSFDPAGERMSLAEPWRGYMEKLEEAVGTAWEPGIEAGRQRGGTRHDVTSTPLHVGPRLTGPEDGNQGPKAFGSLQIMAGGRQMTEGRIGVPSPEESLTMGSALFIGNNALPIVPAEAKEPAARTRRIQGMARVLPFLKPAGRLHATFLDKIR